MVIKSVILHKDYSLSSICFDFLLSNGKIHLFISASVIN